MLDCHINRCFVPTSLSTKSEIYLHPSTKCGAFNGDMLPSKLIIQVAFFSVCSTCDNTTFTNVLCDTLYFINRSGTSRSTFIFIGTRYSPYVFRKVNSWWITLSLGNTFNVRYVSLNAGPTTTSIIFTNPNAPR